MLRSGRRMSIWLPTNNIAPSIFQPIIRSSPEDGEREVVLMRWELIPAKVADPMHSRTLRLLCALGPAFWGKTSTAVEG
jgi:putative SOS response-associated peptidase YedK